MTFRKILFWSHLIAGVGAGVVILIMSVTGVLLTYERQIVAWADARHYTVSSPSPDVARLPLEDLIARARQALPDVTFASITIRSGSYAPASLAATGRTIYLDPYSGSVLGEGTPGVRRFFRSVTDWHRWLAMDGDRRTTARAVTGASNLAFLFIVVSGMYLWLPRTWTRPAVRAVTLFNGRLTGKARDFNWHNVFGFWTALPLFFVVLSGVVISYPWASNLVYPSVGETPPGSQRAATAAPAAQSGGNSPAQARREEAPAPFDVTNLNALFARAEQQSANWQSIGLRLSGGPDAPAVFTIDEGTGGQPQERGTLTLARSTAEVVRWEPFSSLSAGRRLRSWMRFVHTGEYYGIAGQTVAGLASLAGVFLVYTGFALSLRRFVAWRARIRNSRTIQVPATSLSQLKELDNN